MRWTAENKTESEIFEHLDNMLDEYRNGGPIDTFDEMARLEIQIGNTIYASLAAFKVVMKWKKSRYGSELVYFS